MKMAEIETILSATYEYRSDGLMFFDEEPNIPDGQEYPVEFNTGEGRRLRFMGPPTYNSWLGVWSCHYQDVAKDRPVEMSA